ncbi:MAG: bifunctional tetrahydrofolate synthase/dihydrofolate synthase [Burkholderiaceae bacterium]
MIGSSIEHPTTLDAWLARCERLHAKDIDLSLERVHEVRQRLGLRFTAPVITVAGTNGKGSTCAMLEAIALAAGYRVGAYIKPHLVHFEERCRIGGRSVAAQSLLEHFGAVELARGELALTSFEFTTLAIMRLLSKAPLDLVVLEVGLGGRFDAVNAVDADCSVITSIDIDHTEFLGHTREAIGYEKAGVMRAGKPAIVSDPLPPRSVIEHAASLKADLRCIGRDFNYRGVEQQWSWEGRSQRYAGLAYPALRGANQLLNASGALAALEALRDGLPVSAQAVRAGLAQVELPGRFQIVAGRPTLVLDVAHNPHAVAALAHNLERMGFHPRTHAVFGAMRDKDIGAIVQRMAPLVDAWYLTDLGTPRAARASELEQAIRGAAAAAPGLARPVDCSCHESPAQALDAALRGADPADRIVVFGSFYTVGGVLKNGLPRLSGNHSN